MNFQEARDLVSRTVLWYHQNDTGNTPHLSLYKESNKDPKFTNDMWAKLMAEAVLSFSEGLESKLGSKNDHHDLFKKSQDLVGDNAFKIIAYIVSVAQTNRTIEEALDTAFQEGGEAGSIVDEQTFLPAIDLSGYLVNDADRQIYGQFSNWLMDMSSKPIDQAGMHDAMLKLQDLSKSSGISQEFAYILGSMAAEYQILADKYTRESAGFFPMAKKATMADVIIESYRRVAMKLGVEFSG